jgi:hypothetical protein
MIPGPASTTTPQLLATINHPLHGLLLVVAALVAVSLLMFLVRSAVRRFRVSVDDHGPVLVPATAGGLPPELLAVISAAVAEVLDEPGGRIVSITPLDSRLAGQGGASWSGEGRRQHFASHKVR